MSLTTNGPPGRHGSPVAVAIGLGSNLGDRAANLACGRRRLAAWIEALECSRLFETRPRYEEDQPLFLNACCVGRTQLQAGELLDRLKEAESKCGRRRGAVRYGPRSLDLDLLLYGGTVLRRPGLSVPHPRLCERAFVLVPLAEVAGDWVHPVEGRTIEELAGQVGSSGVWLHESGTWPYEEEGHGG